MTGAVVFCTFLIILWTYFLWSRRKYYAFAFKMPGPLGFPLLGIVHKLANREEILFNLPKIAAEYKTKTYFTWLGIYPMVYTMEPKVAEIVLNSPDCINKPEVYDVFIDAIGNGLLTRKSPTWNIHRKLFNPAFSHKLLINFFPIFNKLSRQLCENLEQSASCGEVNIKNLTFNLALRSSVATTLGYDFTDISSPLFLKDLERIMAVTVERLIRPWMRFFFLFKRTNLYEPFIKSRDIVMNLIYGIVVKKIEQFKEEDRDEEKRKQNSMEESVDIEKEKYIFIDRAIKLHQNNEFSVKDIASEANLMVLAGTETTATSLFITLMYLAMYPQYQEKVFEEIDALFPDEEFDVSYGDFKNLVYLDMCINEAMRVSAVVPVVGRVCTSDVAISKDIIIPKGTHLYVDMFNIHRDKDIWGPNAHIYNPDNFLPSNMANKNGYCFLPFLKGPRNCIGWQYARMVQRVALVQVLRKYRFTTQYRFEDLVFVESITLALNPLPKLEVHRRHKELSGGH